MLARVALALQFATMGAYYLQEFVRIVLALLPIALIFIATIFLYRRNRLREIFYLRLFAGCWLAAAIANRLILSSVVGMGAVPKTQIYTNPDEAVATFRFYEELQTLSHFAEQGLFILFAVAFVIFCRHGVQQQART